MLIFVFSANPVGIVDVPDGNGAVGHGGKLSAMPPCIRPRSVIQRIANAVVGDGLAVIGRQLIAPVAVAVGVGDGVGGSAQRTGGIGIFLAA